MLYSQFHHHPLEDVEPVLDARDVVAIQETVFATRLRSQDRAVSRRARRGDAAAPFAQDRLLAPRNVGAIPGFAGACVRSRATHRASDRSARSRRRECESTRRRSAARLSAFLRDGVLSASARPPLPTRGHSARLAHRRQHGVSRDAGVPARDFVIPEDVKAIAVPVLAHRLALDTKAKYSGTQKEDVVREILDRAPVGV